MRALILAVCLALASLSPAPAELGVIKIGDDGGGSIQEHIKFYERILESGVPVRVDGLCISACGLVFMLPAAQVCVTQRSSFGFHLASTANGRPDEEMTYALVRRYFPLSVQNWIAAKGNLTPRIIFMTAKEAIDLGLFRDCDPPPDPAVYLYDD